MYIKWIYNEYIMYIYIYALYIKDR
jgi:hypothetical protein